MAKWAKKWGLAACSRDQFGFAGYLGAAIDAGRTDNGVFAARIMSGSMEGLVAGIADNAETENDRDVDYLRKAFGPVSFVFIHRSDKVAQAVSWAKAEQSKIWHRTRPDDPVALDDTKYSFEVIDGLVRTIEDHNQAWLDWFRANAVSPICIQYEDLEVDPEVVARGVLRELKIDVPDGTDIKSPNIKLADQISQEWIAKYAADRRARSASIAIVGDR